MSMEPTMTPSRPYLLRAFFDWLLDQGGSILRLFFVHQAYDVKNLGEK